MVSIVVSAGSFLDINGATITGITTKTDSQSRYTVIPNKDTQSRRHVGHVARGPRAASRCGSRQPTEFDGLTVHLRGDDVGSLGVRSPSWAWPWFQSWD